MERGACAGRETRYGVRISCAGIPLADLTPEGQRTAPNWIPTVGCFGRVMPPSPGESPVPAAPRGVRLPLGRRRQTPSPRGPLREGREDPSGCRAAGLRA